ncbi:MAG: hypothetical protein IGS38_00525 [Synechococcales cyanobacterium M58_A2018_015]|nr:hypothetical protein [Synechococcales cyanobacterium M58_A2018_015]
MKLALGSARTLLRLTAPLIFGATVATLPAEAATLASSHGNAVFGNFSHTPIDLDTFTKTDVNLQTISGEVRGRARARATALPTVGGNLSSSRTVGNGRNYTGTASSTAGVTNTFSVGAQETFAFDFLLRLRLKVALDQPQRETASAKGRIHVQILDHLTGARLDSFKLFGQLGLPGTPSPIQFQSNPYVDFALLRQRLRTRGNQTVALTTVAGRYSRTFDTPIELRLTETKHNQANVRAIPEPSAFAGLLVLAALLYLRSMSRKTAAATPSAAPPADQ